MAHKSTPKAVQNGHPSNPPSYVNSFYQQVTATENQSVVRSVVIFGVSFSPQGQIDGGGKGTGRMRDKQREGIEKERKGEDNG